MGKTIFSNDHDVAVKPVGDAPGAVSQVLNHVIEGGGVPVVSFEDVDSDGDKDIVVRGPKVEKYWLENTSGTQLHSLFSQTIFRTIVPTVLTLGDVDGDGNSDAVVGHMSGAKLFINDGNWSMRELGLVLAYPRAITIADVNQDGLKDIVIRDSREMVVVLNVDGEFGAVSMTWPDLGDNAMLAVGDFDLLNKKLEILTLDDGGVLRVASHNGRCWNSLKPVGPSGVSSFTLSDANNDGFLDLTIKTESGHTVLLEGDGQGGFSGKIPSVSSSDFDIKPMLAPAEMPLQESSSELADEPAPVAVASLSRANMPMTLRAAPFTRSDAPEPQPLFDFQAGPNLNYDLTPETTKDYSSSSVGVESDLWLGATFECNGQSYILWGDGETLFHSLEVWDDIDTVVNVVGSESEDLLHGNISGNFMAGGGGSDWLFGDGGNDTLAGNSGEDFLFGEEGNDLLAGGRGADCLWGNSGNDILYGQHGRDFLSGGRGDDILLGGSGSDLMAGDSGNDILYGGAGADEMIGDSGRDTFHYVSASEGDDRIWSFEAGKDVFQFEFGSLKLHRTDGPYTGTTDGEGDSFIWEIEGQNEGVLYYDPDVTVSGDEILLASVQIDDESSFSVENISIV